MSRTSFMRTNRAFWGALRAMSLVVAATMFLSSCDADSADNSASNVLVEVVSMGASAGEIDGAGETVTDLLSDVCFANEDIPPCTVVNDNGVVTMIAVAKDQTKPINQLNDVIFRRYRVTFERSDGRNVPGVDVPYPFDGVANFTVPAGGVPVERSFIIVRHQAKRESPLREIALNSSGILSVIARVDFFGEDLAGRAISVTGYLNVTFADFVNE